MCRVVFALTVASVLAACSSPDDAAVDPFDTTALSRIPLTEQATIESESLNQVDGAIVLSTGEVAVANNHSEILVFGPQGDLRRTIGRSGGGPGEFRFLMAIAGLDGDRIFTWDPAQARVTVFRPNGALEYTTTPQGLDLARIRATFVGAFGDGSFVLEDRSGSGAGLDVPDGLRRDTISYLLFARSGALIRTVGTFVRHERYYSTGAGYKRYLLDASVHAVLTKGLLLVGESDAITFARFDSSGAVRPTLTLNRNPRPVTESDIEAGWREWADQRALAKEQLMAQAAVMLDEAAVLDLRKRIRAEVDDELADAKKTIEPATYLPAYESIAVGSDGALWLEDYLSPTMEVSRWVLMDAEFSPAAWIELQPNETFLTAGPGVVVIVRKDALDVESVVFLTGEWSTAVGAFVAR
jgi:hypothetical protein